MTLLYRRILYILFILLFLILTPAVSFYAAGYEFDFNSGKVQRTGILIIASDPKGALINLGDKKKYNWLYNFFYQDKKLTTPDKIRNLLPDEYDITLSKEGYYDYRRKVNIKPGETAIIDRALMFKKTQPQLLLEDELLAQKISPDKSKLAAIAGKNLLIIDLAGGQIKNIPLNLNVSLVRESFKILWSPSNKKVILTFEDYPIFNIENGQKEVGARDYFSGNIERVKWDSFSDNKIYVQRGRYVYQFNIAQKSVDLTINNGEANDFIVKDAIFYTIGKKKGGSYLDAYDVKSGELIKNIALPDALNYTFLPTQDKLIYLYNEKYSILYIIDPWSILPLLDSVNNLRDFFTVSEEIMLYWNDYEIWLYDIVKQNKTLLTRVSERINGAFLLPGNSHIIYSADKGITIIELKDSAYLNAMRILEWLATSQTVVSSNGKYIYFSSSLNSGRGLYRMEIK